MPTQFCRVSFGVTNEVQQENLKDILPYLDNITVAAHNQEEHEVLRVISDNTLTLNESKTITSMFSINVLSYCVDYGIIKPDPERFEPLQDILPL